MRLTFAPDVSSTVTTDDLQMFVLMGIRNPQRTTHYRPHNATVSTESSYVHRLLPRAQAGFWQRSRDLEFMYENIFSYINQPCIAAICSGVFALSSIE